MLRLLPRPRSWLPQLLFLPIPHHPLRSQPLPLPPCQRQHLSRLPHHCLRPHLLLPRPLRLRQPLSRPTPTHGPQASSHSDSDPTPQAAPTPLPFSPGAAPHVFVETATINGLAAPQRTIISAWVEGTLSGVSEVDSNGEYGALIVGQIIGEPSYGGKTITFTIGNLTAGQTAIWQSGSADVLDLTATQ